MESMFDSSSKLFIVASLSLLFSTSYTCFSQHKEHHKPHVGNMKNDEVSFQGKFVKMLDYDSLSNYYVVDMSFFNEKYLKVYFRELVFAERNLVSIDAGIDKKTAWFKSSKTNTEGDIVKLFELLKDKTLKEGPKQSIERKNRSLEKY